MEWFQDLPLLVHGNDVVFGIVLALFSTKITSLRHWLLVLPFGFWGSASYFLLLFALLTPKTDVAPYVLILLAIAVPMAFMLALLDRWRLFQLLLMTAAALPGITVALAIWPFYAHGAAWAGFAFAFDVPFILVLPYSCRKLVEDLEEDLDLALTLFLLGLSVTLLLVGALSLVPPVYFEAAIAIGIAIPLGGYWFQKKTWTGVPPASVAKPNPNEHDSAS